MRALLIVLLGALLTTTTYAEEQKLAAAFAKAIEYHNVVISPDGKHLAVQREAEEGKQLVAIVATDDLSLKGHIPAGSEYSPFNPIWVSDDRLVVQHTQDLSGRNFEAANGELVSYLYNGKRKRDLIRHQAGLLNGRVMSNNRKLSNNLFGYAEVVHKLPHEPNHILISFRAFNYARFAEPDMLYRINVKSGAINRVAEAPSHLATFVLTPQGKPTYAIGLDREALKAGRNHRVLHRLVAGEWQPASFSAADAREFEVLSVRNGVEIYVRMSYADQPDRVYLQNLESGHRQLLFSHKSVNPSAFDFDPKTGELIAVHFDDGYPDIHLVDESHTYAVWYRNLYQRFNGNRVRILSSSDDQKYLVARITGDRVPGQYILVDTVTKKLRYLFNSANWLKPEQLAASQPVSFKARDGTTIHGYLTLPGGSDSHAPLIVNPHGGPYGVRDRWAFNHEVQYLAALGYAVLQINFRGSGGYGWGFMEAGYSSWGTTILNDIIDGTRWALDQEAVGGDRACIVGASFGGYAALMAPIEAAELYRCAVGVVGVYDLELLWTSADIRRTQAGRNYLQRAIGTDEESLRRYSPLHNLDRLGVPVFLAHGKKDWRVDVQHYHRMLKALQARNHPHEAYLAKRDGHGFFSEETRKEYFLRLAKFLKDHHLSIQPVATRQ